MNDDETQFEDVETEPAEDRSAGRLWRGWGWPKELSSAKPGDAYLDEATRRTHAL